MNRDEQYIGIPWKSGGLDRAGLDCRGLALLWLKEQAGIDAPAPASNQTADEVLGDARFLNRDLERGDVMFFAKFKTRQVCHAAVYLGHNRYLHIVRGHASRIDNGLTLLERLGLVPAGAIAPEETDRLLRALQDKKLGDPGFWIGLVIAVVLSVAGALLTPKPKLSRIGNKYGRYAQDALATQASPEIPLADPIGKVVLAGNSIYNQLQDWTNDVSDPTDQVFNKIVVLGSAPFEEIDSMDGLKLNGVSYQDPKFYSSSELTGIQPNPTQTVSAAVNGVIGSNTKVPTLTIYPGTHDISVPADIRASYDRTFPVYGLSGCAYLVFRLFDTTKWNTFNLTSRIKGRKCRPFDSNGFTLSTATSEGLTGADGYKTRFKLAFDDIISVSSLTVDATSHTELAAGNQAGNIYRLNKLKGYVEFMTAPASGATITITYTYYPRAWTQNPASHIAYLLTESGRGKGFSAERLNWASFVTARDYYDEQLAGTGQTGLAIGPRYQTNYAIDFRKPIQEHIRAVLDGSFSYLLVSDGKFVLRPRKSGTSVFSFTESHIIAESFMAELLDRGERANRIHAMFHSEDTLNAEGEVIVDDREDQLQRASRAGNNGIVEENLKFPAVTAISQAERLAATILGQEVRTRWACSFKTAIQGLALEPGDVVDVTHSSQPSWSAKLFRIEDVSHDQEDRMELKLSEYSEGYYI
jgi:hypothetical protein